MTDITRIPFFLPIENSSPYIEFINYPSITDCPLYTALFTDDISQLEAAIVDIPFFDYYDIKNFRHKSLITALYLKDCIANSTLLSSMLKAPKFLNDYDIVNKKNTLYLTSVGKKHTIKYLDLPRYKNIEVNSLSYSTIHPLILRLLFSLVLKETKLKVKTIDIETVAENNYAGNTIAYLIEPNAINLAQIENKELLITFYEQHYKELFFYYLREENKFIADPAVFSNLLYKALDVSKDYYDFDQFIYNCFYVPDSVFEIEIIANKITKDILFSYINNYIKSRTQLDTYIQNNVLPFLREDEEYKYVKINNNLLKFNSKSYEATLPESLYMLFGRFPLYIPDIVVSGIFSSERPLVRFVDSTLNGLMKNDDYVYTIHPHAFTLSSYGSKENVYSLCTESHFHSNLNKNIKSGNYVLALRSIYDFFCNTTVDHGGYCSSLMYIPVYLRSGKFVRGREAGIPPVVDKFTKFVSSIPDSFYKNKNVPYYYSEMLYYLYLEKALPILSDGNTLLISLFKIIEESKMDINTNVEAFKIFSFIDKYFTFRKIFQVVFDYSDNLTDKNEALIKERDSFDFSDLVHKAKDLTAQVIYNLLISNDSSNIIEVNTDVVVEI